MNFCRCPWITRRSSTRGARTSIVPDPTLTFRGSACPFRVTSAQPRASRAAACRSMYSATSIASAANSIRRAPSRASSSKLSAVEAAASTALDPCSSGILSMRSVSFLAPPGRSRSLNLKDTLPSSYPPSTTYGYTSGGHHPSPVL